MFISKKIILMLLATLLITLALVYAVAHKPIEQKKQEMTAKDFLTLPDPPKVNTTQILPKAGN
jgi:sensor histidine kinase regulating citrate/malate metabolism